MANIIISNDPNAILVPSPGTITVVSEVGKDGNQRVSTLAQAQALTDVAPGTIIYVQETDSSYLKGQTSLRPIVLSE